MVLFVGFLTSCKPGKTTLKIVKIDDAFNPNYQAIENLTLGAYDEDFIELIQNFSIKSANAIIDESTKNIVISPVSYYLSLAMLAEMTSDLSFDEIIDVLEMPSLDYVRTNTKLMYEKLYKVTSEKEKILLGNSIWIDDAFSVEENLLSDLAKYYYTLSYHGDLQSLETAQKIKQWVDSMTGNLIQSEAKDYRSLDTVVLKLFSTIYFENSWINQFNKDPIKKPFTLGNGNTVDVDFLHGEKPEIAHVSPRYTSLVKHFENGYFMQFVMPEEGKSPVTLLDTDLLKELMLLNKYQRAKDVETKVVDVYMPKFAYRFDIDLIKATKKLGINDIFSSSTTGFKKVNKNIPIFVTGYDQKAYIELDYRGVKATAVTIVTADPTSSGPETTTITFDRPFIYIIYDQAQIPLFIGVVNNPKA